MESIFFSLRFRSYKKSKKFWFYIGSTWKNFIGIHVSNSYLNFSCYSKFRHCQEPWNFRLFDLIFSRQKNFYMYNSTSPSQEKSEFCSYLSLKLIKAWALKLHKCFFKVGPLRIESKKPQRKTGLLQGYVLLFGSSDGGPHGPRWLI